MILSVELPESEAVWALLSLCVGVCTAVFASWVTLHVAHPRRRLDCWMPTVTNLLSAPGSAGVSVSHNGTSLSVPHIVEVQLVNRGQRDILSSNFDHALPLTLNVGAHIIKVLHVAWQPTGTPDPVYSITGTKLAINPCLFTAGRSLSFSLLVDGPDPKLTLAAALSDVEVRALDGRVEQAEEINSKLTVIIVAMVAFCMGLLTCPFL
ncbi:MULTISPECIES: hypothetical protein [unclassified Streptomyces]|uniref:Uncharacterized protein n=1 Tax=Streptomyces sp. NBC_00060 TaxID=2975636 RepID=A0AAU2GUH9_9ACTN